MSTRNRTPKPQPTSPEPISPEKVAKLINDLPGLVGALNEAIRNTSGSMLAFTLIIYGPSGAMYASNFDAQKAGDALRELVAQGGIAPNAPSTETPQ